MARRGNGNGHKTTTHPRNAGTQHPAQQSHPFPPPRGNQRQVLPVDTAPQCSSHYSVIFIGRFVVIGTVELEMMDKTFRTCVPI